MEKCDCMYLFCHWMVTYLVNRTTPTRQELWGLNKNPYGDLKCTCSVCGYDNNNPLKTIPDNIIKEAFVNKLSKIK